MKGDDAVLDRGGDVLVADVGIAGEGLDHIGLDREVGARAVLLCVESRRCGQRRSAG